MNLPNCLKYLKRGWNRKEGRENKDFKNGGQAGQGMGALKMGRGGVWNPLTNYEGLTALKVVSSTFLLACFVCLEESTCETMKNVFY